tara:strand:- start:229 stop:489 length:261 start_codon:yes stop_codon:yes gene_type:complete
MIKELKYFFFITVIITFIFFTLKFYFSDVNIKNSFRTVNNIDNKIKKYKKNLTLLKNNTNSIIEFSQNQKKSQKKYYFWDLLQRND